MLEVVAVLLGSVVAGQAYVINIDPAYASWPSGIVYYTIPPNEYSTAHMNIIKEAMQQLETDLGGSCIKFQEFTRPAPPQGKYVVITHNGGLSGPGGQSCYTFPGMVASQTGQGQYMAMQDGQNGCLRDKKQAMRILASLLGLRSEHNKPARDFAIRMNPQFLDAVGRADNVFSTYDPTRVYASLQFDYNSITMIDPITFSNGGFTYTVPNGVFLRNTGRLSLMDCQALQIMYACRTHVCTDHFPPFPLATTTSRIPLTFDTFPTPSPTFFTTTRPTGPVGPSQRPTIDLR
ncbi:hypothetical protein BV898_01198 [Hypsibius exemplaris]|uniref:Peptidase metallopeptidase domain-containing protein n=1 Tax=Hypsibius exemplaris TaxID=2072580 RepID=A0A1W0XC31_HYPEX|nr:hypothetical protein BV898_01198 [Hypsibius exemplaris]